jgi:hypothetical protein
MCNCYNHPCEVPECKRVIPMHIADFTYDPEDFVIWCRDHINQALPGAMIFTPRETVYNGPYEETEDPLKRAAQEDKKHYDMEAGVPFCAIAGPDVGAAGGMHPNAASDFDEKIVE